jgi:aspartyl aminopeptidase
MGLKLNSQHLKDDEYYEALLGDMGVTNNDIAMKSYLDDRTCCHESFNNALDECCEHHFNNMTYLFDHPEEFYHPELTRIFENLT